MLQTWLGGYAELVVPALKIIWINILLSGDNAVVIALACRGLQAHQRKWGIILGAGVAIVLRIVFTGFVASLMSQPWLKLVGSLLLFYVAVKLLTDEGHDESEIKASSSLWGAVQTVAIADMVMSLDNVLAIAAAAKGNFGLIVFGLVVSIPLIVAGATLVMALLSRFPILVWAGAALLGWIAGDLLITDPGVIGWAHDLADRLGLTVKHLEYVCAAIGAVLVVVVGAMIRRRAAPA